MKFSAVLLALPLRKDFPRSGGRCRVATKGGICQARQGLTERAHAVTFVTKVLGITRKFPAVLLPLPLGEVDLRSKDGEGAAAYAYLFS